MSFLRKVLIVVLVVLIAALVLAIGVYVIRVLLLAFLAVLLAQGVRGMSDWVARHAGIPDTISAIGVTLLVAGSLAGVTWLLIPQIASQVDQLADQLPRAMDALREEVKQLPRGQYLIDLLPTWADVMGPDGETAAGIRLWTGVRGVFTTTFGLATDLFVVFYSMLFLIAEPGLYRRGIVHLFPLHTRARTNEVLDQLAHTMRAWLIGRLLSMVVLTILTWIGLVLLGMPLALSLSLIAGLLSFIPNIGPVISFVPAAAVGLLVNPLMVVWLALLYIGVQTLESNIITPLIMERTVHVPPAMLIVVQVMMGVLLGILGMLLAAPIVAVLMVLVKMLYVQDVLKDYDVQPD